MRLVKTKIGCPSVPAGVVPRTELFALLNEGLQRPLTLVSAAAGFGKTTLVASWLGTLGPEWRTAWLSLDEDDRDPVCLIRYLVATLQTINKGLGRTLLSSLGGANSLKARGLVTRLLAELGDSRERIILVLDDYHSLDNAEIDCAISHLVERMPERLKVIILSRRTPRFPLAVWRSKGLVNLLGAKQLLFSLDDALRFFAHSMTLDIDREAGEKIWQHTEGWVAGLQMVALSHRRIGLPEETSQVLLTGARFDADRYVTEYLVDEVLRNQASEICDFLRKTSVLERLCPSLCDAVTGGCNSRSILEHLERENVFLLRLGEQGEWYRYHGLFAGLLRSGLDPSTEQHVHRAASAWLEVHSYTQGAFKHAMAAGDIDRGVEMFRAHMEEHQHRGEIRTLLGWLDAFPDRIVRGNADLAAHKAWMLYLLGRTREARSYAKEATISASSSLAPAQQVVVRVFHTYLALNWGDPTKAIALAGEALEVLGPQPSLFRVLTLSFLGQAQSLSGQLRAALDSLRQAFELGQVIEANYKSFDAIAHLAGVMLFQGRLREAMALCETAVADHVDSCGRPLPLAGPVYVTLGALHLEANDLDRAQEYLAAGLDLCQQRGIVYYMLLGQRALARLQHARGDREGAWQTMALAREAAERSESPRRLHLIAEVAAELQLLEGNVVAAGRTLHEALERGQPSASRDSLIYAKLLVAQNQPMIAARTLDRLQRSAQEEGADGNLVVIHILQALCSITGDRPLAATRQLEFAIALAATCGLRRPFLDYFEPLAPYLSKVRHVAPDFVDGLLEEGSKRTAVALAKSPLAEPLTKQELELLHLLPLGLRNQEIAGKLLITEGTAKQYLNRIFRKLDVRNRTEAVVRAQKLGLLRT